MKAVLIILLFSGQTQFKPFEYQLKDFDGHPGFTDNEIVMSCSEHAENLYPQLAEHRWGKSQGWYLKDGSGTLQGYIC